MNMTNHTANTAEAERYGNLARVAIAFHIQTGNLGELDAAVVYARYAARYAVEAIRNE